VIRVKKGKPSFSKVYWFISILNKKKQNSQKIKYKVGFYQFGKSPIISVNGKRLGYSLNRGVIFNESAKKYLYLNPSSEK
jgi:hypothetical protein